MHRKFVFIFGACLLAFSVLVVLPSALFMWSVYEISSGNRIIKDQARSEGVYASSLDQNAMPYKLSLVGARKPDVVAIGSSRAMQFREEFFKDDIVFVNAGGAAASLTDMEKFTRAMLEIHQPKSVILTLDFWWFNSDRRNPVRPIQGTVQDFDLAKLYRFWNEVVTRGLPVAEGVFSLGPSQSTESGLSVLGLEASYTSSGYRPDGSRLYFDILFGLRESSDIRFKNTIRRINEGSNRFEHGDNFNHANVLALQNLVDDLDESGVEVVVVIPPLAPSVVRFMSERLELYGYLVEFLNKGEDMGWLDYQDVESIGAEDCEFIDGFHGGDVVYHRMMLDMSERVGWLADIMDATWTKEVIHQNSGRTYIQTGLHSELFSFKERDFLSLGCDK